MMLIACSFYLCCQSSLAISNDALASYLSVSRGKDRWSLAWSVHSLVCCPVMAGCKFDKELMQLCARHAVISLYLLRPQ